MSNTAIIGSGFSGLSAASFLAKAGQEVHVFEKNETIGGRARQFKASGYTFDMGPSWYWMPDVIEKFFNNFGHSTSEFYDLKKLDPGFRMVFNDSTNLDVPENFEALCEMFEKIESGAAAKLVKFMDEAEYKYKVGVNDLVYQPGNSLKELMRLDLAAGIFKLQVFTSFSKHIRKFFKNPKLLALLEFPILFLGATPKQTPALYSLMNYAGLKLGTFYPIGGFSKLTEAMQKVALKQGVNFHTNHNVEKINIHNSFATSLTTNKGSFQFDNLIGSADYEHIENKLLDNSTRNYSSKYWDKKVFAPSCLLFYLGINKKVDNLLHHTLFFNESLDQHADEIYTNKKWPTKPLFYVCCPSKTDSTIAPIGKENLFVLMPIATGLKDTEGIREKYFDLLLNKLEKYTGTDIINNIEFKRSYCINDFKSDYNSYQGNAYGLANTLMQTANLKPKMRSKKVKNMIYAGQLTVPGPGVPPSIISGQVAAEQILKSQSNLV
tara:strand:- start:2614 stop:4092 length:1479 start_codon:yes stop_codon:yes gene_type:complete